MPPPRKSVCKRKEPTEQACLGNTTFRMTRRQVKRKGIHTHTYKGIHNNQAQQSKQSSHKLKHLHLCFLEQTWKDGYIQATQTNKSHRNAAWYFSAKLAFCPFEARSVARNFINRSSSLSLYSHLKSPHRQHIWVMRSVLSRNVSRQATERRDLFFPLEIWKKTRGAQERCRRARHFQQQTKHVFRIEALSHVSRTVEDITTPWWPPQNTQEGPRDALQNSLNRARSRHAENVNYVVAGCTKCYVRYFISTAEQPGPSNGSVRRCGKKFLHNEKQKKKTLSISHRTW